MSVYLNNCEENDIDLDKVVKCAGIKCCKVNLMSGYSCLMGIFNSLRGDDRHLALKYF